MKHDNRNCLNVRDGKIVNSIRIGLGLLVLIALPGRSVFSQELKSTTVECKSEKFQRSACPIGAPIVQIRIVEKKSGAACVEGSSYGFSGDSVWVDKGCEGKFEVKYRDRQDSSRGDSSWGDRRDRRNTETTSLRCSSDDFRRATCDVDGTIRSVTFMRQRSQARCQEGSSFGFRGDAVWVDKGCDADFEVRFTPWSDRDRPSRPGASNNRRTQSVSIACKSHNFHLGVCYVSGPIVDLQLVRKKSRASCALNRSYGYRNDYIWVKDGCEADFDVRYRPNAGSNWEFTNNEPQTQTLVCKSDKFRREVCRAGGIISDVRVKQTRSRAACKENSTYGFTNDEIWVTNGCEAEFEVLYFPRP